MEAWVIGTLAFILWPMMAFFKLAGLFEPYSWWLILWPAVVQGVILVLVAIADVADYHR